MKPGYWWKKIDDSIWQEQVEPYIEQKDTLFGYPQSEFLAKQYK